MEMRKRGVETDFMLRGGDRLGIYFLETGAVSRGSKVVYDRAYSAMSEIEPGMVDWDKAFEGVELLFTFSQIFDLQGSPVRTLPPSFLRQRTWLPFQEMPLAPQGRDSSVAATRHPLMS